jgi:hypothetical protein
LLRQCLKNAANSRLTQESPGSAEMLETSSQARVSQATTSRASTLVMSVHQGQEGGLVPVHYIWMHWDWEMRVIQRVAVRSRPVEPFLWMLNALHMSRVILVPVLPPLQCRADGVSKSVTIPRLCSKGHNYTFSLKHSTRVVLGTSEKSATAPGRASAQQLLWVYCPPSSSSPCWPLDKPYVSNLEGSSAATRESTTFTPQEHLRTQTNRHQKGIACNWQNHTFLELYPSHEPAKPGVEKPSSDKQINLRMTMTPRPGPIHF